MIYGRETNVKEGFVYVILAIENDVIVKSWHDKFPGKIFPSGCGSGERERERERERENVVVVVVVVVEVGILVNNAWKWENITWIYKN